MKKYLLMIMMVFFVFGCASSQDCTDNNKWVDSEARFVTVYMDNRSSYSFEVVDGEFAGTALHSGQYTDYDREIPIGVYTFRLRWVDRNGKVHEWDTSRIITPSTGCIKIIDVKR